jgi:hypothetical protein
MCGCRRVRRSCVGAAAVGENASYVEGATDGMQYAMGMRRKDAPSSF